jgi:hypothetical protein
MQIHPTTANEAAMGLGNFIAKITFADLVPFGAGTTGTLSLYPKTGTGNVGTLCKIRGVRLITAFVASDVAINSLLIEGGITGATAAQLAQTQLFGTGTPVLAKAGTGVGVAFAIANTLNALFTVAGGASPTLGELTSGEVWVYFQIADMSTASN